MQGYPTGVQVEKIKIRKQVYYGTFKFVQILLSHIHWSQFDSKNNKSHDSTLLSHLPSSASTLMDLIFF